MKKTHYWALGGVIVGYLLATMGGIRGALSRI